MSLKCVRSNSYAAPPTWIHTRACDPVRGYDLRKFEDVYAFLDDVSERVTEPEEGWRAEADEETRTKIIHVRCSVCCCGIWTIDRKTGAISGYRGSKNKKDYDLHKFHCNEHF